MALRANLAAWVQGFRCIRYHGYLRAVLVGDPWGPAVDGPALKYHFYPV